MVVKVWGSRGAGEDVEEAILGELDLCIISRRLQAA